VPFFLWGGTCLCEGRGERVTPLPNALRLPLMLVLPPWGISTAAAYGALQGRAFGTRPVEPFLRALAGGDSATVARESFNRLEEAVFELEPRQRDLQDALARCGAAARMSGSGSSVWHLPMAEEGLEAVRRCVEAFGARLAPV
jgi:4-diphosphocytidyl-2-C-methyl-D-erythritol kinase